jgi:hypothetical protein
MKRSVLGWMVLFLVLMFPINLVAGSVLVEADGLFEKGGLENLKQSIPLYLKAVQENPDDFETNWKCARAYREYGNEAKKKGVDGWKTVCKENGKLGMEQALKAIALDSEKPNGHYYYGLNVGIYSDGVSIFTALKEGLKDKTQTSFEKAYEQDKMYKDAGPILSLGRFWAVLPWPLKDKKKSLEYYREYQKTSYFADSEDAHIYLAELLQAMGGKKNKAEAAELLEMAAKSDDKYFSDWAKRLLAK